MPIIPAWSYCIVAVIMGAGMVWYIINRLNQAEADRIEKLSSENYAKGQLQATEAEDAERKAKEDAKNDPTDKPVTDW
jgi:hypothetical protein